MTMHEVISEDHSTVKPADCSGEPPTREAAAEELTAEIKSWADSVGAQSHSLGGMVIRARNTQTGEMIAIAALGSKRLQLRMLLKLLEVLDRQLVETAIQYYRGSPLEKMLLDILIADKEPKPEPVEDATAEEERMARASGPDHDTRDKDGAEEDNPPLSEEQVRAMRTQEQEALDNVKHGL